MKFLQIICCVAMLVFLTQACREGGDCSPICAKEMKDETLQRTFKNRRAMDKWNEGVESEDEKYQVLNEGRCEIIDVCPAVAVPICAIPEIGVCGEPLDFGNFCELDKYNSEHLDAEYEYYHDDDCNKRSELDVVDCECLECDIDKWEPVCAVPEDVCGRPVTFSNRCWLQKFNCALTDYPMRYWHEGDCYSDDVILN